MLIRIFIAAFSFAACLSPDAKDVKGEKSLLDAPKSEFEKKLSKMSDAEVDTTYSRICRNLIKEKTKIFNKVNSY